MCTPTRLGCRACRRFEKIAGAILTFGLVTAVAGVAISAIAWAAGSHSSNPHVAGRGKNGVLVACAAALLIGGANALVTFFHNAGGTIH